MHVVATAGHVDHGKSTLVRALTGTDPDRLSEEKERGLTIDLGFASTVLASGRGVAFIDVPGHVRFLKNMLAGVGGVNACVFVVAATDGWMPQSEEHLRILDLLGLQHGFFALTKIAGADPDLIELARLDIAEHAAGTFLAGAPIVPVDSVTSHGVAGIAAALDQLLAATPTSADQQRPRLWIDRVFAAKGAGTVVTGTLTGGRLAVDESVSLLPGGHGVRIRGLQSLYRSQAAVGPGQRVAVNLTGVGHYQVRRGDVLVRAEQWHSSNMVDAEISVLAALDHALTRRGAHMAYIGSGEHPVRVRVLGPEAIEPGSSGALRLYLPRALPLLAGDRFILREAGRGETVGGGEMLDVDPVLPAAKARPDRSIERTIAERGHIRVDRLELLTGVRLEPDIGSWAVDPATLEGTRSELGAAVEQAGMVGIDLAGLSEFERAVAGTLDGVTLSGGRARLETVDCFEDHPFVAAAETAPFRPPDPDQVEPSELRELLRRGQIVESGGVYFAARAIDEAARVVAGLLAAKPEGVTVAEVRDAWGTTRKYALPLLSCLDGSGVTRRRGDLRIGGPRLPQV